MNPRGCEDAAVTWRPDAPGAISLPQLSNQITRGIYLTILGMI